MQFTEEQRKVIEDTEGRLLVVACPGSGKTTTILERVNYMIHEKGINPYDILVVTFTRAAAQEMKERFDKRYENGEGISFSTIHSLCFSVLRQEFGLTANNILKEWEQMKHFKMLLKGVVDKTQVEDVAKIILGRISYARNAGLDPYKECADLEIGGTKIPFKPMYKSYEQLKKNTGKIDFDDMLILCLDLFKSNRLALAKYQNRYKYIIIDEYQDTNMVQAQIFYMLSETHGNLCVVGDDDQSIYGFRSADSSIMLNFKKKFKDAKKYTLSTNYRSGTKIVKFAGNLISRNATRFKKNFLAGNVSQNGEISIGEYSDEIAENMRILKWIEEGYKNGTPYNEMAVLYRTNKEAISLLPLLKCAEIPISIRENPGDIHSHFIFEAIQAYYYLSTMFDGEKIPNEGKEYLVKILNCPSRFIKTEYFKDCDLSESSVKKCVREYFKKAEYSTYKYHNLIDSMEDIKDMLELLHGKNPTRFLKILTSGDFEDWVKSSAEYRQMSAETALSILKDIKSEGESFDTMEEWMEYVGEYKDFLDSCGNNPDGVRLSTFHGAKGLEWDKVWVKNITKGNVPFKKSIEENGESGLEEERRMFYVAITRARDDLQLSYLKTPSSFIADLITRENQLDLREKEVQKTFTALGIS